jgi:lysophospholipase L1-like esterase
LRFTRYVALGDSSTEGLEDPVPGARHRGWADRLAKHVAQAQGAAILYANLAVRGRTTREIRAEQLGPALAMQPDLATVFSGTNDLMRSNFDLDAVCEDALAMQLALRGAGATVLTITMPDLSAIAPIAKQAKPRLEAYNARMREICAESGALLLDVAQYPVACDPRLWHEDRLHANTEGHTRIAQGLARTLGLPGIAEGWDAPLPPMRPPSVLRQTTAELRWLTRYLLPWMARRALGQSSGAGIVPKYAQLTPVTPD